MRVPKETSISSSVHVVLQTRGVGAIAEGAKLLLAVLAVSAGDLERSHYPLTDLEVLDVGSYPVDYAHKFVAQDVTFLQSHDFPMIQMQIRSYKVNQPELRHWNWGKLTADGGSGDFDNYIIWVCDVWNGSVYYTDVICAKPGESFHCLAPFAAFVLCFDVGRSFAKVL